MSNISITYQECNRDAIDRFFLFAYVEPKVPQRGTIHQIKSGVAGTNPYIFLTVPRGRSQSLVQGFEVIEDDESHHDDKESTLDNHSDNDDDDNADDEDAENSMEEQMDEDDEEEDDMTIDVMKDFIAGDKKSQRLSASIKNAKNTQMMVSREHAGAIMVPDEIIEIEGQSVIDEKTGKPALLLPRSILDSIPDGSVVALMERPAEGRSSDEERANRVIVRRRRKGSRRNVKRRGGNRRRRRGGNKRRVNRRKNVRVVRVGGNRRRGNRRRVVYQG